MEETNVNLLVTTFAGLGLPRTLSLPVRTSTTVQDALETIHDRLPCSSQNLIVTTTSNKQLRLSNTDPVPTLLSDTRDAFLPLRLSSRLCGGKGGFGSQLRAAGGRMSSRKKRNQQNQPQNGSNRNLDGRRLHTVDTAKKLAKQLAEKPEMEKREREQKRKRWEAVVDMANKKEEEIKSGKVGAKQGRLTAEYTESKELAEERTRDAVVKAMRDGMLGIERTGSESSVEGEHDGSEDEVDGESESSSADEPMEKVVEVEVVAVGNSAKVDEGRRTFFGWDDDEDDDSDESEEDEPLAPAEPVMPYTGKGKARVT